MTSADVERGFSAMERVKTCLRSTMTDERLSGLALLSIHRDIEVDIEKVVDNFAKKDRRMRLH